MDKTKFYEHQYVSIREEIKETKARIFKLAWLGLIGVPTAYLFAEKYEILVVTLTMPVIICTLMLLFIAESMALMRAGRYIRLCIEPIIIEFVPKAEKKESNDVVEEEEPSDEVDATGATDCFLEVGWERWPPLAGQLGGVVKVDGVCCFHAAASVTPAMGRSQYASSGVLSSRLE